MKFYRNLTKIFIKTFKTNIDLWTSLVLELLDLQSQINIIKKRYNSEVIQFE